VAVGGTNPVLVDRVGSALLGLWGQPALARELGGHTSSPPIELAAKRLKIDLKAPALQGEGAALLASPRPVHYKAMAPFSIDWDPPGAGPTLPAVAVTALSTSTAASTASSPTAPIADSKPDVHAIAIGHDEIQIDGRAGEPIWARAKAASWTTDYAGSPTPIETHARFLWSSKGLYALFDLSGAGLHTDTSQPTSVERQKLYQEDCVELFFTPDPAHPKHYYEIELGPFGHFFDLEIGREHHKESVAWSSGATIGTTRNATARTATIEVLLTAPEITGALAANARLPIGLFRTEGEGERTYLAWSPPRTTKPNFHVPESFGFLVFDAP
jgi:hypothetical protein